MLRILTKRPANLFKSDLSNYWRNSTSNLKRAADCVDGTAEEGPLSTLRLCGFPYQYSKTDLIEFTKAIIQVHLTAQQMTEVKVHASNNAKSTVLELYSRISVENALKIQKDNYACKT